jgi:glycosyltransferase involved in cell wall biosynthesis
MPKVSIIVPVYKAEAYLSRCVESILAQSFTDFELLLIDDHGPDRSGDLCDQYAARDKRIRVIHKEKNEGASAARNTGLDVAEGEYIMFCDSDDTVSPEWVSHLMQWANPNTLVVCAYCHSPIELGRKKVFPFSHHKALPPEAYFSFQKSGIAGFLWNAVYHRHTIETNHLRFRTKHSQGDYNEDLIFNLQYLSHMEQVLYNGYADYLYEVHQGSLSRSYNKFYFTKYAEKYALWKDFLLTHLLNEELPNLASNYLYHFLISLKSSAKSYGTFRKVALSSGLQDCIWLADCSKENPKIIQMLKKKAILRLWIFYLLHSLKG